MQYDKNELLKKNGQTKQGTLCIKQRIRNAV
jgi:hypothetical protein